MENRNETEPNNEDRFTPKQRFLIKLLVSIITLIYAVIELIKIIKNA